MAAKTAANSRDVAAELAYLARVKAPTCRAIEQLADRARARLGAMRSFTREMAANPGGEGRIRPPALAQVVGGVELRPARSQTRHHMHLGHPWTSSP